MRTSSFSTRKHPGRQQRQRAQRGVTMLETMMAVVILTIVIASLAGAFAYSASTNKAQGEIATRCTEYAQDKIEQLMALSFTDTATNTTVFPSQPNGGSGLAVGGGINPAAPVANYVDYLDTSGNPVAAGPTVYYTRVWSIAVDATGTLKTISVVAQAAATGGARGALPTATLVTQKTNNQ